MFCSNFILHVRYTALSKSAQNSMDLGAEAKSHAQVNSAKQLQTALEDAGKILVPLLEGNLVDNLWGDARPAASTAGLRIHALERAGETVADKIKRLRSSIKGVSLSSQGFWSMPVHERTMFILLCLLGNWRKSS